MIVIHPSETADTRTCDFANVSKETLLVSSKQHINDVRRALDFFMAQVCKAGQVHDPDKLTDIDGFHADFITGFKQTGWWDRHRKLNRHHLTMADGIPDDVNLIDVLDFIADCVMAGMARSGSVYALHLPAELLDRAFQNTVELLKSQVTVEAAAAVSRLPPQLEQPMPAVYDPAQYPDGAKRADWYLAQKAKIAELEAALLLSQHQTFEAMRQLKAAVDERDALRAARLPPAPAPQDLKALLLRIVTGDGQQLENLAMTEDEWNEGAGISEFGDGDIGITMSRADWFDLIRAVGGTVLPSAPAPAPQLQEVEMTLSLHRCKICGTRWLLWPDAIHGGGWNLLDRWQRPGACCDNVAMGEQIEHLRDIDLGVPAPAPAWQPMETAPKDGTHVVLFGTLWNDPAQCLRACVSWYCVRREDSPAHALGWFFTAPGYSNGFNPTHWQPLPPPPDQETK